MPRFHWMCVPHLYKTCHRLLAFSAISHINFGDIVKYIFVLILVLSTHVTSAAAFSRSDLVIKTWHPASTNRIHSPSYNGNTRVYFETNGAWGSSSCRVDSADIRLEDTHILSSMLAAFIAGKSMRVEVNDALPTLSEVCKITAVFISR